LLLDKHAVITGASSGLGLASARALAAKGVNLTLLARTEQKLLRATQELRSEFPDAKITEQVLDVSNLDQIRTFARGFDRPVDILMNNAGVMGPNFELSIDGIESQMATNHIGHFLLTTLLWEQLEKSANPRVIAISSVVHRRGNLQDLSLETLTGNNPAKYDRWQRYADTKLANLMFARELDTRSRLSGSKVRAVAAHPGWAITGLQDNFPNRFDRFAQDARTGARSQVLAATEARLSGGEFIGPKFELWGEPKPIQGSKASRDLATAKRLWELSEELTGQGFLS
jgi:NAD(P)-dependent dehydrogenase (short-subunit alcohol dehydrogenase family)